MRIEQHNLDGQGDRDHDVYDMPPTTEPIYGVDMQTIVGTQPTYWPAVTDVPCPVEGCDQHVVWYEAGYVPGYRVCMRRIDAECFDAESIRHRFLAQGNAEAPTLVLDD